MNRSSIAAASVAAVLGAGLWLALVPHDGGKGADPRVAAFRWIMIAVALVAGAAAGRKHTAEIGFGLGCRSCPCPVDGAAG